MAEKPTYKELEEKVNKLELIASDYKHLVQEHKKNIRIRETMEQLEHVYQIITDVDGMLDKTMEIVLQVFQSDRSWLVYPCNPDAPSFSIAVESCRPEFPGAKALNLEIPMTPVMADYCRKALTSKGGVNIDPEEGQESTDKLEKKYSVKSMIFMVLSPQIGDAWMFGLHQCDHVRHWTKDERQMFKLIGHRITNSLNNKLYLCRLKDSEATLMSIFKAAPIGIGVTVDRVIKQANDRLCEITGYTRSELLEKSARLIYPTDEDFEYVGKKEYRQINAKGTGTLETRWLRKDGKIVNVLLSSTPLNPEDLSKGVAFTALEITDWKKAENELRESEEKYRKLFNMESDTIFLVDTKIGEILEMNEAALDLYQYSREELLNKKITDLSAEPEETRRVTLEGLTKVPIRYHRKKDGTVFPVEIILTHFKWEDREVHISAIRDISFRIEAQREKAALVEQVRQAQKMESIGNLAGGIAHDFNNILSPILIYSEMAMAGLPSDSRLRYYLQQIYKAGDRAKDLVKQILTFSRKKEGERIPIIVSPIIKEALKMLRASIPTTIEIHQNLEAKNDIVVGDPTQIHQVLMNLCSNAADAMGDKGGIIEVGLYEEEIKPEDVKQSSRLNPGHYLRLSVSDNGHGMDEGILANIFEPYFTTKEKGKGTGLGLAVVHGIINSYGGDISVESELGTGTTFYAMIPRTEGDAFNIDESKIPIPRGNERILFVDDEAEATEANKQMLENLGYQVTAITDSLKALEVFSKKPDDMDLVITDMTMPNMTGRELAEKIISIRSNIPIIICTGYSDQIDENKAKEAGIKAFVMKPIVMGEMAQIIREVLDTGFDLSMRK